MRQPLFEQHPRARAVTMRDLMGIANAVEQEAVRRYGELARLMERNGETATADALRRMQREEEGHAGAIAAWASRQGVSLPPSEEFSWQLPPEIAASWEDVSGSALLTPYRAYAIAVRNEERAFALYVYLAAQADDAAVAREAERLASEELEHATLLRRWRRAAYHAERPLGREAISSPESLAALLSRKEAGIVGCHREISQRLRKLGERESAAMLEEITDMPSRMPDGVETCQDPDCRDDSPLRLLIAAQKPLESLSEELEAILEKAEGETAATAERALQNMVARLARLRAEIERLSWGFD